MSLLTKMYYHILILNSFMETLLNFNSGHLILVIISSTLKNSEIILISLVGFDVYSVNVGSHSQKTSHRVDQDAGFRFVRVSAVPLQLPFVQ